MIAVFAALDRELASLRQRHLRRVRGAGAPSELRAWAGPGVILVRTGMGRARAQEAAAAVLSDYPVAAALSIGLAGALRGSLEPGEVLLCELVTAWTGPAEAGDAPLGPPVPADPGLLGLAEEAARRSGVSYRRGRVLTFPEVVWRPEAKARLGRLCGADAVEMESAWVGQAARERGVPFLVVRAIADPLRDQLPPMPLPAAASTWTALAWLAAHPWHTPGAVRTAGYVWRAQRNLALVAGALLRRLSAGPLPAVAP
ncbi:MAG: hypothetical protein HY330_06050 [Chloroflexi bacterium]|nr:hypothetical protein [Chloroflexota bacterium]